MESESLSYLQTPANIQYRYQTTPDRLRELADELGDREAFVFLGRDGRREAISARELYQKSTQLAKSLVKFGVAKGDIVGLCMDNDLNCLLCYFGVILAGGVVFSFALTQKDASDVKVKLDELGISTFILHSNDSLDQFYSCLNFIDDVSVDAAVTSQSVPCLKRFVSTTTIPEYRPMLLDELFSLAAQDDTKICLPRLDPDDTMIIYATSGSTGWPKFIPFTHQSGMIFGYQLCEVMRLETDDILYTERKLVWLGGFPFGYLHNGAKTIYKYVTFPSLEEHCIFTLSAIRSEKCTQASLIVATIVEATRILQLTEGQFPLLKCVSTGGQPCPPQTMGAIGVLAEIVRNGYGATECGCLAADTISEANEFIPFSSGIPYPGVEIKVVGADGHVVKRGETGTVHVRSPTVVYQYYNNPAKTREAISNTHWFNTTDVGYVTKDGRLVVMGREAEQIVQGGAIVHPAMVEAVVKTHPSILDVVVISLPDAILFQRVCACVILKPGCTFTIDDVVELYKSREYTTDIDPFASLHPTEVVVFDNFPTLPSDKPDKVKIKECALRQVTEKKEFDVSA